MREEANVSGVCNYTKEICLPEGGIIKIAVSIKADREEMTSAVQLTKNALRELVGSEPSE